MLAIHSNKGYPKDDQLLLRVDYFIGGHQDFIGDGVFFVIGKDSKGIQYVPAKETDPSIGFKTPNDMYFHISSGPHPVIHFPYRFGFRDLDMLKKKKFKEEFFEEYVDLQLMDQDMNDIHEIDIKIKNVFMFLGCWAWDELRDVLANHFWGEMYTEKIPEWEVFLQKFRKI